MNKSILREESKKINLSKSVDISFIIKTDNIINHNFENMDLKINGFVVEKIDKYFFVNKSRFFNQKNLIEVYEKTKNYNKILLKYKNTFLNLINEREFITSDIKELILYIYYDLVINFEIASYKHSLNINNLEEKRYIDKLIGKNLEYCIKKNKKEQKEYKKSTLIQRGSNTKYWNRVIYSKELSFQIVDLSEKINPIELELPLHYENEKVISILEDFYNVLEYLKIENRNFQIRFKKIRHYKKEGLYLKNSKTLIIDPRNSQTIFHEFGHFIHETNSSFFLDGEKITKRNRNKIIKNNKSKYKYEFKNHKIEELDEESETFAYWFEDLVLNDILNKKNNINQRLTK